MKQNIFILTAVISSLLLCGCEEQKLITNPYLGKLPSLQLNYYNDYNELNNRLNDAASEKEQNKIIALQDELTGMFEHQIEQEAERIEGKTIPFTIKDHLPYDIVEPIIIKEGHRKNIHLTLNIIKKVDNYRTYLYAIPQNGDNMIGCQEAINLNDNIHFAAAAVGDTIDITYVLGTIIDSENWQYFTNLHFTNENEFTRYKNNGHSREDFNMN